MNDPELELFEKELSRLKPSAVPASLLSRLKDLGRGPARQPRPIGRASWFSGVSWSLLFGRVLPAAALPLVLFAGIWLSRPPGLSPESARPTEVASTSAPEAPAVGGEVVQIDETLLTAFEAVAEVPGRGPVRFRYSEWEDRVVVREPDTGMSVEQRRPRIEIVPVAYETF